MAQKQQHQKDLMNLHTGMDWAHTVGTIREALHATTTAAHLHSGSSLLLRFGLYFLERFLQKVKVWF